MVHQGEVWTGFPATQSQRAGVVDPVSSAASLFLTDAQASVDEVASITAPSGSTQTNALPGDQLELSSESL